MAFLLLDRKLRRISYQAKSAPRGLHCGGTEFVASRPAAGGESCSAGFYFYSDIPILSTIPNLLHVFSVYLMNCYFSDFWYRHVTENTFTLAIERTYTHQNEIENMYIQIFTKILLTCGKLHGILFLKKIFQGKLAEKQGRKARRD